MEQIAQVAIKVVLNAHLQQHVKHAILDIGSIILHALNAKQVVQNVIHILIANLAKISIG